MGFTGGYKAYKLELWALSYSRGQLLYGNFCTEKPLQSTVFFFRRVGMVNDSNMRIKLEF